MRKVSHDKYFFAITAGMSGRVIPRALGRIRGSVSTLRCNRLGQAVVLIHGTPFSSQVWRRIAPVAARFRRVFYFDLLGYGMSEQRADQDVSLGVQNRV